MSLDMATGTHAGHVRTSNEDHVFADPARGLVVVADGMGGEQGGEIASAAACAAIDAATCDRPGLVDALVAAASAVTAGGSTIAAVQIVNATAEIAHVGDVRVYILRRATSSAESAIVGSTLASPAPTRRPVELAHVGDVRVYVLRRGPSTLASAAPAYCPPVELASGATMVCATRDHSSICELVEHGHIDRVAAASHPLRSRVNRALGRSDPRADVALVPLVDGDRILACSDGLWSATSDDVIANILDSAATARAAVDALIECALSGGGPDNIGVAVVVYSSGDT